MFITYWLMLTFVLATPYGSTQNFNKPIVPPRPPFISRPNIPLPGRPQTSNSGSNSFRASNNPQNQPSRGTNSRGKGNAAIVANSVQEIALDLSFGQWYQGNGGNLIFSPLSIGSLLSLLMLGTQGSSYNQLKSALYYPNALPESSIHQSYEKVINNMQQNVPGVKIQLSNDIFLQKGLTIMGGFTQDAKRHYQAGVTAVDFAGQPTKARKIVNGVVSKATDGRINEIAQQPFNPNTVFVAINTIYFNGLWKHPFDKRSTYEGTFKTGSKTIGIPMMVNEIEDIPHLSDEGLDMIALPYKGGRYSMYILKPTGDGGVTSLITMEKKLDPILLNQLIKSMTPKKVSVTMPRMSMRHRFSLKPDLAQLGVTSIFNPQEADFGRMTSQRNTFIDEVIHEAVLEITETGTVAAAATMTTTDRILITRFALDRPSLLIIKDINHNIILFWARLVEPTPLRT